MTSHGRWIRMLLALSVGVFCGCKGQHPASPTTAKTQPAKATSADGPRQAVKNMVGALTAGDREAFMDCFTGSADELKAPAVMFDMNEVQKAFRADFIKAYGQAGWDRFQNESPGKANAKLRFPEDGLGNLDKIEFTVAGDAATAKKPDEKQELKLLRQAGVWRVEAASFIPPGADVKKFTDSMGRFAGLIATYRKAIGAKGVKCEDIDYELGRAIAKQMFGLEPREPHRFEIDKL